MVDLVNLSPFAVDARPSSGRDGEDLLLVVIAAAFSMPPPRHPNRVALPLAEQAPVRFGDTYDGDPADGALLQEGQACYTRPATDITVEGDACAPGETPVERLDLSVRVGPCAHRLRVFGDRVWRYSTVHGAGPSPPERFVRVPLSWRRAFGGRVDTTGGDPLWEPRNPVGTGLVADTKSAIGLDLPNFEDPTDPIFTIADRPAPAGVGPVARAWQPRVRYGGTYDESWRRSRAPFWPKDFDESFFCAAVPQLQARPHLKGGERVQLDGLHPAGRIDFDLPVLAFSVRSRFAGARIISTPRLDAVMIDCRRMCFTLVFRAAVRPPAPLIEHRETWVRLLDHWEHAPP